jgi:hypothetical protein
LDILSYVGYSKFGIKAGESNMGAITYETFKDYVDKLEQAGVIRKGKIFGYQKTFRSAILNYGEKVGRAVYVISRVDGKRYCLTNGKFKRHLRSIPLTETEYLSLCGLNLPTGYKVALSCRGKRIHGAILELDNGKNLYFMFRSVMACVSSDYRKLMLYYGMEESEARAIADKTHHQRSSGLSGERNPSYGRRGVSARCLTPFLGTENPSERFGDFLQEKNKLMILQWASDNDVDETNYDTIRFLYHSPRFKEIHQKKGIEAQQRLGLSTVEQGIFAYNHEKGVASHDPRNFLDYCAKIVKLHGGEDDKRKYAEHLEKDEYYQAYSLAMGLQYILMTPRGLRFSYHSQKHGEFKLRSKLEKGFVYLADRLEFVRSIKYETVKVPYSNGIKDKKYWIDFELILDDGMRLLVEVKPYRLCIIPDGEILLKKKAAEEYALRTGSVYLFVTEKDMKDELIRKKLQSVRSQKP